MRIGICTRENSCGDFIKFHTGQLLNVCYQIETDFVVSQSGQELLATGETFDILFIDKELIKSIEHLHFDHDTQYVVIMISCNELSSLNKKNYRDYHYLLRPLSESVLKSAIKTILRHWCLDPIKLAVETKDGVYTIWSSEIIMIESAERKSLVYTKSTVYHSLNSMQYWNDKLGHQGFYHSHKSYIVNMLHIDSFTREEIYLSNNRIAYMAKRRYKTFKEVYLIYLDITNEMKYRNITTELN